jgi:3D (Asp-Asp-Asp) domain-containing protein
MKLFYTVIFFSLLASAAFAREESILARVTSYWAAEGSKFASTGRRLHSGHCAVDPKRIPYGSKVVFPDRACTAVDTGPAVISRKAARLCGRTASQLKAIVVDRFFETKREAMAWTNAHPHFMTLQIVRPGSDPNRPTDDKLENIRNRFSHDDRDLQLRAQADAGQTRKRLYIKGR